MPVVKRIGHRCSTCTLMLAAGFKFLRAFAGLEALVRQEPRHRRKGGHACVIRFLTNTLTFAEGWEVNW